MAKGGIKDEIVEQFIQVLKDEGIRLIRNYTPKILKMIKAWWNNKTVAILGPAAAGKDSFLACLRGMTPPDAYMNTAVPDIIPTYRIDFPDGAGGEICFNVKEGQNVGGEDYQRDDYWDDACKGVNVIFYLVDMAQIYNEVASLPSSINVSDTQELRKHSLTLRRLGQDMRFLKSALSAKEKPQLAIVLNKFDLPLRECPGYDVEAKMQEFAQKLQKIEQAVRGVAREQLGEYKNSLKSVKPLSCIDKQLFAGLFPSILKDVAGA